VDKGQTLRENGLRDSTGVQAPMTLPCRAGSCRNPHSRVAENEHLKTKPLTHTGYGEAPFRSASSHPVQHFLTLPEQIPHELLLRSRLRGIDASSTQGDRRGLQLGLDRSLRT
jgi:hypothetical protein